MPWKEFTTFKLGVENNDAEAAKLLRALAAYSDASVNYLRDPAAN